MTPKSKHRYVRLTIGVADSKFIPTAVCICHASKINFTEQFDDRDSLKHTHFGNILKLKIKIKQWLLKLENEKT